jgi:hypothetical protein
MNIPRPSESPDIEALIDVERKRIEDLYGREASQAVAHIMQGVLVSVYLYAEMQDMSPVTLMRALSDSISAINKLSKKYVETTLKAKLN